MENNSHDESARNHARHAELVAQLEGRSPQASQAQTASSVNQSDLQWLAEMQNSKDDQGRRRYDVDTGFRHRVEAARMAAMRGESLAETRRMTERVLRGEPATEPEREVAPPQGLPSERRQEELTARLDAGEFIAPGEVDAETYRQLTGGYNVHDIISTAGPDFAVSAYESHMLEQAAAAGVPESMIRRVVQQVIRSQQR